MASGLLMILDDIAALLDDAAVMSKVAAKKTAAILGDDLAVNAEKATGFSASRELPVVWAITKGSLVNKLIILPLAFLLSAYLPGLIVPILLVGGAYLSYEGAEKVVEWFRPRPATPIAAQLPLEREEILKREAAKIRSAIRTDFILSIEIIVIALGTVLNASLAVQVLVVSLIALAATVGVYGAVALLVRMDDAGFYLMQRSRQQPAWLEAPLRLGGQGLVAALPWVIRLLGVVGTLAMLLVGGGLFVHNIEALHHALAILPSLLPELLSGLGIGALLLLLTHPLHRRPGAHPD
ncbi:DUF808 domain-containing protein [Aestuariirhabdus litorea]|uniref:DUF808 domain-containing protein n=1 Tax=Aestuariirhabdus litorea TaxID=2528527 RepID=A0A3P3VPU1_9GAMM|nr:DUF808 domain-containing protein [Aestuariirhabdus litorea]RRJ83948.1 DUF808 domain-containing protein [Aestuariirhabdus litorea]RWW97168.1 DUF808 family protein [Endozoicomonadaceae bacterium GTF-13]